MTELTTADIERLRDTHYNATVEHIRHVHDELAIFRIRPDDEQIDYLPGQYTTLGLGDWEPRRDGLTHDGPRKRSKPDQLIRRAYSISCSMLNLFGLLTCCAGSDFLEFYVALVNKPTDDPPPLTPRLFALEEGARIHLGTRPKGNYTLEHIRDDDNVMFAATGTGEAPHNAMAAQLLTNGHQGNIAILTCVRYRKDLAYLDTHREIERQFSNYRYVPLTTREPENLDRSRDDFVGKRYVQDEFTNDSFADHIGWEPKPENTHVYLCGNPAMIGLPKKDTDGDYIFPEPHGMVELLTHHGFTLDEPNQPGNIHFEKFW